MDYELNKKTGYAMGYEKLVKISSEDTFPEYIEKEADESIEAIKKVQSEDGVSFAFITDNHYMPALGHDVNFSRTMNAYKKIAESTGVDKIILGGDHTVDGDKEHKLSFFKAFRKYFKGLKYFPVNGNHDDGTIWDRAFVNNEKSVNHLTHKELYDVFYNHLPELGAEIVGEEELYYLYNDNASKTRYVFLDVGDIPYIFEDGTLKYLGIYTLAMSQKQIDWLVNKALRFNEEGWGVIFISHWAPLSILEPINSDNKYLLHIWEIVDAYKRGEDLKKDYYDGDFKVTVNAEFSKYKKADITGFFIGHNHVDRVSKTGEGIPVISTGNAGMFNSGEKDGVFEVVRNDGDKTEILFDIVTIDKTKRKIYMTRVGVGENREIEY